MRRGEGRVPAQVNLHRRGEPAQPETSGRLEGAISRLGEGRLGHVEFGCQLLFHFVGYWLQLLGVDTLLPNIPPRRVQRPPGCRQTGKR